MNHRERDQHHDAEESLHREVAPFRCRLIADLWARRPEPRA